MGKLSKVISAEQYNSLPRGEKRKMERQLKKEGLEMPEIRERLEMVGATVDKELYLKAAQVLERSGMTIDRFMDLAFTQLINSQK